MIELIKYMVSGMLPWFAVNIFLVTITVLISAGCCAIIDKLGKVAHGIIFLIRTNNIDGLKENVE